jgi:hypothetical protein
MIPDPKEPPMPADREIRSADVKAIVDAIGKDQATFEKEKAEVAERKPVRGRKSNTSDHQEAIIKLSELNPLAIETMIADLKHAQEAATILGESIKMWAEKAGIQSSVLRKFIAARAGENFPDKKRDALQLSLLFEEIGE